MKSTTANQVQMRWHGHRARNDRTSSAGLLLVSERFSFSAAAACLLPLLELGQFFGCALRLFDLLDFRHWAISCRGVVGGKVIARHKQ
jgi:hypothetical protein